MAPPVWSASKNAFQHPSEPEGKRRPQAVGAVAYASGSEGPARFPRQDSVSFRRMASSLTGSTWAWRRAPSARAAVEPAFHLVGRGVLLAGQVTDDRRIDVPRARAHDQAFQGREAHRRVHRPAARDRGGRTAVAQL